VSILSKSKLMRGFQCLKSVYLTVYRKELEPPPSPETQTLFDQGKQVGLAAQKLFPGGVLIDGKPWEFKGLAAKTRDEIKQGAEVLYEAAFLTDSLFCRTDILKYNRSTSVWDIYEVKSAVSVKPESVLDLATQYYILTQSGLRVDKVHLVHLNKECRFPDLSNLFQVQDLTEEVLELQLEVERKIEEIYAFLNGEMESEIDIGPHCDEPYECPFKGHCFKEKGVPKNSVFDLPRIGDKAWQYYRSGVLSLTDIDPSELNEVQARVQEVVKTGQRFVDKEPIKKELSTWDYPLVFLDFETCMPAIPRYPGTKPYQQVPFQFSAHILSRPGSELVHHEYLHADNSDPRPKLIENLLKACGEEGAIVAFSRRFEMSRIKELAEFSPKHAHELEKLTERFVDPLPIIRDHVYDKDFQGSFSLKYVAPALLGKSASYQGMVVSDGGAAQRAFEKMINPNSSKEDKGKLREALLEYCRKDTLEVVNLFKWLSDCR